MTRLTYAALILLASVSVASAQFAPYFPPHWPQQGDADGGVVVTQDDQGN